MTRSRLFALASLLAAALLSAPSQGQQPPAAGAQPPATGARPPAAGQPAQPGQSAQPGQPPQGGQQAGGAQPEGQPAADGPPWPVMVVTSVEVLRSSRAGGMDIVRARGLVTSGGWDEPHLLPITRGEAIDGVLDLIFQAHAPTGAAPLGSFMVVEAILPVEAGHPYKGVRVRSGTNAVTLKTLPGYAETAAPKEDCAKCIGKFFVAKGATPPAGAAADSVVREADLPWPLRIIKPTDGIPNYSFDPNRLTLVLSEDGKIVDGAWD
jgi:hypothetical protein